MLSRRMASDAGRPNCSDAKASSISLWDPIRTPPASIDISYRPIRWRRSESSFSRSATVGASLSWRTGNPNSLFGLWNSLFPPGGIGSQGLDHLGRLGVDAAPWGPFAGEVPCIFPSEQGIRRGDELACDCPLRQQVSEFTSISASGGRVVRNAAQCPRVSTRTKPHGKRETSRRASFHAVSRHFLWRAVAKSGFSSERLLQLYTHCHEQRDSRPMRESSICKMLK
jgi:hypothetical protein